MMKMYATCSVWSLFTYIYQQLSSARLQKFVVSTFFHYKSLQCALFQTTKVCSFHIFKSLQCVLFQTTKVCSVHIFPLQRFVGCAFQDYKSLQSAIFQTTKVCSVRFFRLQKFVLLSLTLCRYMGIYVNVSEELTLPKQSSIIIIPPKELQSRLPRGKGQSRSGL